MKFVLALGSIITILIYATVTNAQVKPNNGTFICSSDVSFELINKSGNQAQIDEAIRHFLVATSNSSLRIYLRTTPSLIEVEVSLLNSSRGAAEILNQEVVNVVKNINPAVLSNVSVNSTFRNCRYLPFSNL